MLIKNAKIFTMEDDLIIENGFIFIENNIIKKIGHMSKLNFEDENTIDLNGKNIYPGFIDAHTHIGLFENGLTFEGDDGNEETDPITPNLRVLDGINPMDQCFKEAIKSGVTTVIVSPGSANPIAGEILAMKTHGICIDDMIIKSPIAIKFALGENPKNVYNDKNQSPSTRMATAALIREKLSKAKIYYEAKKISKEKKNKDLNPKYNAKCEALIPLFKKSIAAHFHAHRADDIFTAIRIAKEFDLDLVLVHGTEGYKIKDYLKKDKIPVLCGPIISDRSKPELLSLTPESPGILSNSCINTAIITDHPETPIHYLRMSLMVAVKNGMSKKNALKAITINPAKICNIEDKVGSIKVGKDADLVVFENDIFDFYSEPERVMCSGKIVYKK